MIISKSSVAMASSRRFTQIGSKRGGSGNIGNFGNSLGGLITSEDVSKAENGSKRPMSTVEFRDKILSLLIQRVFSARVRNSLNPFSGVMLPGYIGNGFMQGICTYHETEETCFSSQGKAVTEDGREIEFNVELSMSRSYVEYENIDYGALQYQLMDPLVVNIGAGVTQIRDQKFKFDLDSDGKEEEISFLGEGSGFLALDLNNDGKINNGSELFGTKSGNGFYDLMQYDTDKNGWIDEADKIYGSLKVWYKNEDGKDTLISLKEANIGAIYTGSRNTEFSKYGQAGGLNSVIKSTGIFLKENGGVGTIQQVDMVKGL